MKIFYVKYCTLRETKERSRTSIMHYVKRMEDAKCNILLIFLGQKVVFMRRKKVFMALKSKITNLFQV